VIILSYYLECGGFASFKKNKNEFLDYQSAAASKSARNV